MLLQLGRWRSMNAQLSTGLNFDDCCSCALAIILGDALLFKGDDFSRTDVERAL